MYLILNMQLALIRWVVHKLKFETHQSGNLKYSTRGIRPYLHLLPHLASYIYSFSYNYNKPSGRSLESM